MASTRYNPPFPLYLLPGLGGDRRMYAPLRSELEFEVVEFIRPVKGESMRSYATRMAETIPENGPFIIGGVSFGAMVALEIAEIRKAREAVVISSVKDSREFPFYFKLFRYMPLHKLLPGEFFRRFHPRSNDWKKPQAGAILRSMHKDADPWLIKWAVDRSIYHRRKSLPCPTVHIHGSKDRLFPSSFVRDRKIIKGGNHVMILSRAPEVADLLKAHWEDKQNEAQAELLKNS